MRIILWVLVNAITLTFCDQLVVDHSIDLDQNHDRRSQDKVRRKGKKKEKWLVDSIFYDDYQSDGRMNTENYDFCPPVPEILDQSECIEDTCKSDMDCSDGYRCCFNGCTYSCLFEVQPAPVVDWLKEPRRSRSGISWLLPDKKEPSADEAEPCTTGPFAEDEDPLLCPHGYFCYVDTENRNGKKKKRKSNSGHCVKQADDQYSPGETAMALTAALRGRRICHLDGIVLLDGASIRMTDKKCNCKRGYLTCSTNKSKEGNVKVDVKVKSKPTVEKQRKKTDRRNRRRHRNKLRGSNGT